MNAGRRAELGLKKAVVDYVDANHHDPDEEDEVLAAGCKDGASIDTR
jgi:hypothetical protein